MHTIEQSLADMGPQSSTVVGAPWPWVKGYNGEFDLGPNEDSLILTRLWIDQDLKKEMGH